MIYVYSAAAGFLYGALMGGLKYAALWRKILTAEPDKELSAGKIYIKMSIGCCINVLTLLILFFVRNMILPLSFTAVAIAAAVGLSVTGRLFSIRKVFAKVNPEISAGSGARTGAEEAKND